VGVAVDEAAAAGSKAPRSGSRMNLRRATVFHGSVGVVAGRALAKNLSGLTIIENVALRSVDGSRTSSCGT